MNRRLLKECDSLYSKLVLSLWGHRCSMCGGEANQVHHIIKRVFILSRHALLNGIPVCVGCHRKIHDNPQVDPLVKGEINKLGDMPDYVEFRAEQKRPDFSSMRSGVWTDEWLREAKRWMVLMLEGR